MIKVENVVKTFGAKRALDGLNMNVPKGSVYGLIGPNGCGKSTIIRHITGSFLQDSGKVYVGGAEPYETAEVKARIGYIPDDIFYFGSDTIEDMMHFYRGLYPNFDMNRYEKFKGFFEITEKMQIRRMSKGMIKQAGFWLTMSMKPDVYVLDEPLDGLDPVMRRQILGVLMDDVAERGTTVLVSSHNLRELEDICDHVGIMHKGRLLLEKAMDELQQDVQKVRFVLMDGVDMPQGLNVVHDQSSGKLKELIVRANEEKINAMLGPVTVYLESVPLSLEEIFIYEMGGVDYEVKSVILS